MIFIAVKFPVRPERADEWLGLVDEFTQAVRAEPGNLFFEWSRSVEEPNTFVLLEGFRDADAGKVRLHIDLSPTDRDQDEELDRLLGLGAVPTDVGQTGEENWHVLADPEGNEFCLLRRRLAPL